MSNRELYRSRDDIKVPRWKKIIAGLTATAALYPLSACGNNETTEASNDKPVATATANQEKQSNPQTPEDYVGIANNSFEGLNVQASPEAIERAKQPISGSLSLEEAMLEVGWRINVINNSAHFEGDEWDAEETQKSTEDLKSMLIALGLKPEDISWEDEEELREWIGRSLELMKILQSKTATYQTVYNIDSIKKLPGNKGVATGYYVAHTNLGELDSERATVVERWDELTSEGLPFEVVLANNGDTWGVVRISTY